MASGFQRPPAPGERPESAQPSGVIGAGGESVRGYASHPAITTLCQEALDGALTLVRADGGELALLDASDPQLVTRARRSHPPRPARTGYGAPSMPSQPLRGDSVPDDQLGPIDDQITQLLPSAQLARVHKLNQGLIGAVWKRREPFVFGPSDTTLEVRQTLQIEVDAPQHLAVPIFQPERLDHVGARGPVIGVLRVFRREEMWSFATNDTRLLELQADRLARALALLDAPPPTVRQDDLAAMVRELTGVTPAADDIYARVVEIITREHPSLAVCALRRAGDELAVAHAMRHGVRRQGERITLAETPPTVRRALQGDPVTEAAPVAAAYAPLYSRLGWDTSGPLQETLAAPIGASPRITGALLVSAPPGEQLTPDLAARLEATALAASIFLDNARLLQDARRSVERFEARTKQLSELNNAVLTLNASLDEEVTLQKLADQARAAPSARVAAVFVRDEVKQALVCRAVASDDPEHQANLVGATIPLTWNDIGKRPEQDNVFGLPLNSTGDTMPNDGVSRLRGVGARFIQFSAIARQETQLGALIAFTPNAPGPFAPAEAVYLYGLASQAAVAIGNARLFKQLEEAYERQKELDRLKDDFILTVSHEFRTPLTAIEGYVTLISRHGQKLDQEKLATFAGEIHLATAQLAGMISMLADASRLSDQALRVTMRAVSLAEVASEAISRQPPEEKKRIQTRIEDTIWVMADDERLPLVFSNLISNALKYSGGEKPCRVSARVVTHTDLAALRKRAADPVAPDEWVIVTVEDEGPGISADDQAHLFQKFVRLQQSLTTSVRGTGLGLWICRQYIEAMGGEIWVDSRHGHGARFSFSLPRVAAPPPDA